MKTLRLVAMLLALTALPVQGQLEFSAGMNLSDITGSLGGSDLQNLGNRAGKVFGVGLVLPMGGLGLNLGVDWSQKGVEDFLTDPGGAQELLVLLDLQYLELPLHLRIPLVSAGPVSLNAVLGPTFGIRIGCEVATYRLSVQAGAMGFTAVFDDGKLMTLGNVQDLGHLTGLAHGVDRLDGLGLWGDGSLDEGGIQI